MKSTHQLASDLAEAIEEFIRDTREPAKARGQMLRTVCDEVSLDELAAMIDDEVDDRD